MCLDSQYDNITTDTPFIHIYKKTHIMTKKDYKKPESKTVMLSGTTILAGSEGGINAGIGEQPGSKDPIQEGGNTGMEIDWPEEP